MLDVMIKSARQSIEIDASFKCVQEGITTLFGPSGSGKSTILNVIAGLDRSESSKIILNNLDITKRPTEARRFGYVFQDNCLFPHMTVKQNLSYGSHPARSNTPNRNEVIDLLDIRHLLNRKPSKLSGGEGQRVAIARALLSNAEMLLMDEPLSSLDNKLKKEIMPLLRRIATDFKCPILYVSHSFDEVCQLSDKLILINNGKILGSGSPQDMMTNPKYADQLDGFDAGNLLNVVVKSHDHEFGLTNLEFSGGIIPVPLIKDEVGSFIRLRIRARDITLATSIPTGISTLIRLPATVNYITDVNQTHSYVHVTCGTEVMIIHLTRKSIQSLGIEKNKPIFCLVKSVTLEN
ncbi:molybdenum ABC transporter ATP-binding protein [Curvivirga aplysinae]|uniref:molybdenum ABC transporter ATP-binding protein n=1 Tax=Curvivirga aplysinae TaxID=2529852 RepID=UPI0012BC44E3|nr:molybdenum ABC transporter ATP-binding protein [Curvivirga aplysinae]MTI09807.1 molybdenum ABC transporter ATP-binding protein [Curvivirga aplysinae]